MRNPLSERHFVYKKPKKVIPDEPSVRTGSNKTLACVPSGADWNWLFNRSKDKRGKKSIEKGGK